jgi:hypothetical protein
VSLLDTKEGREALIWACAYANDVPKLISATIEVLDDRAGDKRKRAALIAAIDPAKLAELTAAETRRHGIETGAYGVTDALGEGVVLLCDKRTLRLLMPQARAILLALLQLPDGAREDAERILRGEVP